jgi:ketosteroid isomerase-like protein
MTDTREAAQRWARTWRQGWERREMEPILELYAPDCAYWSEPHEEPYRGLAGAREYVSQAFESEHSVSAWFSEPLVDGDRAVVSWWATLTEDGAPMTLAGHSVLRFNAEGLVAEEWDAWNSADSMRPRPFGWVG